MSEPTQDEIIETEDKIEEEPEPKPSLRENLYSRVKFSVTQMNVIIAVIAIVIVVLLVAGIITSK